MTARPKVYINEALSPLKKKLQDKAKKAKVALPDKTKFIYFRNGILRIQQKDVEPLRKIHNDVELEEFLKEIIFEPAAASNDDVLQVTD